MHQKHSTRYTECKEEEQARAFLPNIVSKAAPIITMVISGPTYSPNMFNDIAYYSGGYIRITTDSTAHMKKGNKQYYKKNTKNSPNYRAHLYTLNLDIATIAKTVYFLFGKASSEAKKAEASGDNGE